MRTALGRRGRHHRRGLRSIFGGGAMSDDRRLPAQLVAIVTDALPRFWTRFTCIRAGSTTIRTCRRIILRRRYDSGRAPCARDCGQVERDSAEGCFESIMNAAGIGWRSEKPRMHRTAFRVLVSMLADARHAPRIVIASTVEDCRRPMSAGSQSFCSTGFIKRMLARPKLSPRSAIGLKVS